MHLNRTVKSVLVSAIIFATIFCSFPTEAYVDILAAAQENYNYDEYYIIETNSSHREVFVSGFVNLINFVKVNSKFPLPSQPYNRKQQFGGWIRPDKSTCLNTRGFVLNRDSKTPISVNGHCTVTSGDWNDPYTNQNFNRPSDLQIDHMVPLKNAYMTGGYEWNAYKRCLYANFLGNSFHLIAIKGAENSKKGDRSPREYMPPHRDYICTYLRNWLEIKYVWQLRLTPPEVKQIQNEIQSNHCADNYFLVSTQDIEKQNRYIEDHKSLCKAPM